MPGISPNSDTSSSYLTVKRQSRTLYANYIVQKQKLEQGCAIRVEITSGVDGTAASDNTNVKEGATLTPVAERLAILAANQCSTSVPQLTYAIPDFTYTTNTHSFPLAPAEEPATWTCIASGLPNPVMNGTYTTTGSHFYLGNWGDGVNGDGSASGTIRSFRRIKATDASGGWLSRTASNNYRGSDGAYTGSTTSIFNGASILGEYMTITTPYYFILDSYTLVSGHRVPAPSSVSSWRIGGSKDGGLTYSTIDVQTNVTITGNTVTIQLPPSKIAYNSYRIVVTKLTPGNTTGANIDSWNLFTYI